MAKFTFHHNSQHHQAITWEHVNQSFQAISKEKEFLYNLVMLII